MNFFGHAVVAAWTDDHAGHLLGSMLPDFEAMVRVPLLEVRDPDIRRGIELHHETDHTFHRTPTFVALCSWALEEMIDLGVRRGTSRAVAHIGTELFLDGWLAKEPGHVAPYVAALETAPDGALEWQDQGAAFEALHVRLRKWGAPRHYQDPEFVLARLADSLRRRPVLAVRDEEAPRVASFLPSLHQMVERRAPELLGELRKGLGLGH
ncbi:MAG: hypothetical protein PVI24_07940 [Myxococcales bacterium]